MSGVKTNNILTSRLTRKQKKVEVEIGNKGITEEDNEVGDAPLYHGLRWLHRCNKEKEIGEQKKSEEKIVDQTRAIKMRGITDRYKQFRFASLLHRCHGQIFPMCSAAASALLLLPLHHPQILHSICTACSSFFSTASICYLLLCFRFFSFAFFTNYTQMHQCGCRRVFLKILAFDWSSLFEGILGKALNFIPILGKSCGLVCPFLELQDRQAVTVFVQVNFPPCDRGIT